MGFPGPSKAKPSVVGSYKAQTVAGYLLMISYQESLFMRWGCRKQQPSSSALARQQVEQARPSPSSWAPGQGTKKALPGMPGSHKNRPPYGKVAHFKDKVAQNCEALVFQLNVPSLAMPGLVRSTGPGHLYWVPESGSCGVMICKTAGNGRIWTSQAATVLFAFVFSDLCDKYCSLRSGLSREKVSQDAPMLSKLPPGTVTNPMCLGNCHTFVYLQIYICIYICIYIYIHTFTYTSTYIYIYIYIYAYAAYACTTTSTSTNKHKHKHMRIYTYIYIYMPSTHTHTTISRSYVHL